MDVKLPASIREIVVPCVRLIKLMMEIDRTASFLILLTWVLSTVQQMLDISLETRITTHTYRFLTNTAPYAEIFGPLVRLWILKGILGIAQTTNFHYQDTLVRKIKKKMKQKMNLLLLDSFFRLDYV